MTRRLPTKAGGPAAPLMRHRKYRTGTVQVHLKNMNSSSKAMTSNGKNDIENISRILGLPGYALFP